MKNKLKFGMAVIMLAALLASLSLAEPPPSLTDFQKFYGTVSGLPQGSFQVKAVIGANTFTTDIASNGQYGYDPVFKVKSAATEGTIITFSIVNKVTFESKFITNVTYQKEAIMELNMVYPAAPTPTACTAADWSCTAYPSECPASRSKTRTCTLSDILCINPNTVKPAESEACTNIPTWSDPKTNLTSTTALGSSVLFKITLSALNPDRYIFSWYNGSNWVNDTSTSYTKGETVKVVKTTSISTGNINWTWYFNDTSGNATQTDIWGISIKLAETVAKTCTQQWSCSLWSACSNAQQTRTCRRTDDCSAKSAVDPNLNVLVTAKPSEQSSCVVSSINQPAAPAAAPAAAEICFPTTIRCSGQQLQQCSNDGTRWDTLKSCSGKCDSSILECVVEQPIEDKEQQPSSSLIFYVLGFIVLALVIAGIVYVIKSKANLPARQYIAESRSRGYSNQQIKQGLVRQGWDAEKVDKMLRT